MTPHMIIDIGQHALEVTISMIAVLLLPALGVGLLVSMFQAATQINEMTLSFIPKIIAMLASLYLFMPMLIRMLVEYAKEAFTAMQDVPF